MSLLLLLYILLLLLLYILLLLLLSGFSTPTVLFTPLTMGRENEKTGSHEAII